MSDLDAVPAATYDFLTNKSNDPWEAVADDRARCPVAHHPTLGVFQVTGYKELETVLKDWETYSSVGTVNNKMEEILAFVDPPRHTRQRRLFSAALGARSVAAARPFIQATADELIDGCAGRTEIELVEEYANPLVLAVICHLIGAPTEDIPRYREWTKAGERLSYDPQREDIDTIRSFRVYSSELVADRRANLQPDDLVSSMIETVWENDDGTVDQLSEVEICNILEFLLVAANSTTTDAIGNLVWALESNPDQSAMLRADIDGHISGAVEEVLRFDGPIHALQRTVTTDTELGGVTIPAGATMMNVYGAAGHDPAAYDDPDSFRIDRDWDKAPHHFGFGWATHYCLGSRLARQEISVAVSTLYRRLRGLKVVDGFRPTQVAAPFLRGWERIPMEFDGIDGDQ